MFFVWTGRVIAHLIFWLGLLRVGMGLLVAFGTADMENNQAAARRYLGAATSGEAINDGMMYVVIGVSLGVLCQIAAKVSKADKHA